VLLPVERTRRARWETVLRWYGLHDHNPDTSSSASITGCARATSHSMVACLSRSWRRAGRFLADAIGARFVEAQNGVELGRIVRGAKSPVLIGSPDRFAAPHVQRLADFDGSWSIVTAADEAGASFVIAKMLAAAGLPARASCWVDAV